MTDHTDIQYFIKETDDGWWEVRREKGGPVLYRSSDPVDAGTWARERVIQEREAKDAHKG